MVGRGGMDGIGGIGIWRLCGMGGGGEGLVVFSLCFGVGVVWGLINGVVGIVFNIVWVGVVVGLIWICIVEDGGEWEVRLLGEVVVSIGSWVLMIGWGRVMGGGWFFIWIGEDDSFFLFFNFELLNFEFFCIIGDRFFGVVKFNGIFLKRGRGLEILYLGLFGVGFEWDLICWFYSWRFVILCEEMLNEKFWCLGVFILRKEVDMLIFEGFFLENLDLGLGLVEVDLGLGIERIEVNVFIFYFVFFLLFL